MGALKPSELARLLGGGVKLDSCCCGCAMGESMLRLGDECELRMFLCCICIACCCCPQRPACITVSGASLSFAPSHLGRTTRLLEGCMGSMDMQSNGYDRPVLTADCCCCMGCWLWF